MNYRTKEQYQEIIESIKNGNWTQGAKECVEYGYYANDLISKAWEDYEELLTPQDIFIDDLTDIALLIEMATKMRYEDQ